MLISLTEYAALHDKNVSLIRALCAKGRLKSAKKIGKCWIIDSDEPYPADKRVKSGKYVKTEAGD